jgi:hypothetical protein
VLTPPSDPVVDADATRRAFLKKVAIGGAMAAIGTQVLPIRAFAQEGGGDDGEGTGGDDPTSETTQPGTEGESEEPVELTPDEQRVTFLAGIGLAAAIIYRAATGDEETEEEPADGETTTTAAEPTTTLPPITVPPLSEPVVEVLRVFGSHHSQQSTGLNGMLTTAVEAPNGTLVAEVRGALGAAADEAAVLALLRDLEERIAATHLQAIADLEDVNDASLVATALPIVGQHALVLGRIGATPTPLEELIPEEQTTDGALDEATYPADGTTAPPDTPGDTGSEEPESNDGGEGADPDTGTEQTPDDGTEQSGGGAESGGSTDAGGSANDPESEG